MPLAYVVFGTVLLNPWFDIILLYINTFNPVILQALLPQTTDGEFENLGCQSTDPLTMSGPVPFELDCLRTGAL